MKLQIFSWVVIAINVAACATNLVTMTRYTRMIRRHKEQFARLLAFAAIMSSEESGAPAPVRAMARDALPPGTEITMTTPIPMAPGPSRLQ